MKVYRKNTNFMAFYKINFLLNSFTMKFKSFTSLLVAALAMFSLTAKADEPFRLHRYSSFKALPACQDGDIVFIGNSITNMMNWYEAFGSRQNIHGRGNSGGYTQEILDNLESMIAGNPSKVFLMIGTNDLGTVGDFYAPALVAERIQKIIARTRTEAPNATVYYESILPSLNGSRTQAKTEETNNLVKAWIESRNDAQIVYVDLYSKLVASNGALNNTTASQSETSYSYDGLHLTQKGYRIWMETIKDYVGYDCVYPAAAVNLWGGLTGSNGMRVTYFGASPVKDTDILMFGDEMIHNGEWHELLGSADFKDRGIGWGYPSVNVNSVAGTFDAALSGNTANGVSKATPRAVCLYAGLTDVAAGTDATTIFGYYQTAVNSLRTKLPNTPIFVMTVCPFASSDATKSATVQTLNNSIRTLANDANNIYLIDAYNATMNGTSRDETCFMGTGNIYLTGIGYARVAQAVAEAVNAKLNTTYKAVTTEEAQVNVARFTIRTAAYGVSHEAGTTLGTYDQAAVSTYNTLVEQAIAALENGTGNADDLSAQIETASATVKEALNLPTAANTEGREFQLFTPNRGSYYLTSNGAGSGLTGASKNNYNEQRWRFVARTDGKWNIQNVGDESYISPVASWNAQVKTSETEPASGWELHYCDAAGLYNISSGTVELNQTTLSGTPVYNWSNGQTGTDRSDTGCQFQIVDVTDIPADVREPVVVPEVPEGGLSIEVNLENGLLYRSGTSYNTAGTWCSQWKSTDELLTFTADANNMQWNSNHIDARSGSTGGVSNYTLACDENYVITGFTMKLAALSSSQTWTINDDTYVTASSSDVKTVSVTDLNTSSVSMVLTGANDGTLLTDFVVVLKQKNAAITVDLENGTLTQGTGSTFYNTWTSNSEEPQVELYLDVNSATNERRNNISVNSDNVHLQLWRGSSDCPYRIGSLSDGYVVTGYEFDFICNDAVFSVVPAEGGESVTGSTTETKHVSVSGLSAEETYFTITGSQNKSITVTNFKIYMSIVDKSLVAYDRFVVFENPSDAGVPYRIPAIAKAQNGDLIAVADYRYSHADIGMATNGKLDLRFRIKDHETGEWGEVQTLIAARGTGSANVAFGDPCIVADRTSNRVLVTSCCGNVSFPNGTHANHQGWAHMYSEDGGKTWSEYTDRADQVFNQLDSRSDGQIRCFFIGSGKITQSTTVKVGEYYRLYCAALVKVNNGTNTNYVFYSDDFGVNWNLLGTPDDCPIPSGADEPKAEELPDGSILVSSRMSGGRYYNIYHFTNPVTGEGKWGQMATSNISVSGITASSNACNGETMCLPVERKSDGKKMFLLLQSVPFGPTTRTNVGINYKELADLADFHTPLEIAKDWDGKKQFSTTTSAYSTMTLDADNDIAFFYEENNVSDGYDMVYKKISVEQLTDSLYAYATMASADSIAYLKEAINGYFSAMSDQFGPYVGQYSDDARTAIEAAQDAYDSNPGQASYAAFNQALEDAPRVVVEEGKDYFLRNYGRSTATASYVMSLGTTYFVGANEADASIDDTDQHFRFVATGNEGEYYLYHPANDVYFGCLAANETQTAFVNGTANAGTFRLESNTYGLTAINNTNHTGSNAYIHLAGDNTRLVPWTATDPSLWYIAVVGSTDAIEAVETAPNAAPAAIYDLSGRRVNNPVKGGVYIIGGKKILVK